jgi:methionyl-tRNA formyltransferase
MQPPGKSEIDPEHRLESLDVMVVAAYGMILPEAILNRPRYGCINVHASLLPRWRGAAPIQRAILAGDRETGITIMQMDAGLDTGDILYQAPCPIRSDDTAGSLHDTLAALGGKCLLNVLERLAARDLTAVPQSEAGATYADKIRKEEARIDWSRPAVEIDRRIRAFNPAPLAYTVLEDVTLRIWQAMILNGAKTAPPGTIAGYSAAGLDISTGDGILRVLKLQLPGKKVLACRDFYHGNPRLWQ